MILVHIGYHKTGTSYLQQRFFQPDFGFLRWPTTQRGIHPAFVDLGPFDRVPPSALAEIEAAQHEAEQAGHRFVISHERLSGHPASGGYDARTIADRLQASLPSASVLIVIREQSAVIRSAYSQFVTEGGSASLRRYLDPPEQGVLRRPMFSLDHFAYTPLISYYQDLFGAERVLVLPYEFLRRDAAGYLNRIGTFVHPDGWQPVDVSDPRLVAKVNPSHSVAVQGLRRLVNASTRRSQLSEGALVDLPKVSRGYAKAAERFAGVVPVVVDAPMVERQKRLVADRVGNYFAPFNRETSERIGIDLGAFGYVT